MPKISVIVPVYNVEKYLARCIDSILDQTFTDFELILVDDGSTDSSGRICDEYARVNEKIYVFHVENGGAGKARNTGIDWVNTHSDSEWICFVDSDDWICSHFFEWMLDAAVLHSSKMAICGYKRISDDDSLFEVTNSYELVASEEFYCSRFSDVSSPCGKIYSKELFKSLRYPEGIICEDAYISYQLLFMNKTIVSFNTPLYAYYMSEKSVMRSKWSPKRLSAIDAFQSQIDFFEKNHYEKAYKQAVFACEHEIAKQYFLCKDQGEYTYLLPSLRKKLRKQLIKYRKTKAVKLKDYPWVYEVAFPNIMRLFWKAKSLKKQT